MGIIILIILLGVAIYAFNSGYAEQLKRNTSADLRELEKFRENERVENAAKRSADIIMEKMEKQNEVARFHAAVAAAVQDEMSKLRQQGRQYGPGPAQQAYNPQPNPQPQRSSWRTQKAQSQINPAYAQPIQYPPQQEAPRQFDEVAGVGMGEGESEHPMPAEYNRDQDFPEQRPL